MLKIIQQELALVSHHQAWLIDSFPATSVKPGHRFKVRVAKDLADRDYCVTKKLYYMGCVCMIGKTAN
ncbi:hypothetical protein [Methylobacter sp. YRD-M1]|uniref:hypothetical protein n=1 Tax=Methylobacter sp. YRD-M1 TaxID=2911520 RepID=UPI00227A1313|nr:hypothetical protein [Methylobacter sp. YRD-M1]WAK02808.1 hypothetical protein LZ558_03210 [Methylobacter sp. YRD-M1]